MLEAVQANRCGGSPRWAGRHSSGRRAAAGAADAGPVDQRRACLIGIDAGGLRPVRRLKQASRADCESALAPATQRGFPTGMDASVWRWNRRARRGQFDRNYGMIRC